MQVLVTEHQLGNAFDRVDNETMGLLLENTSYGLLPVAALDPPKGPSVTVGAECDPGPWRLP